VQRFPRASPEVILVSKHSERSLLAFQHHINRTVGVQPTPPRDQALPAAAAATAATDPLTPPAAARSVLDDRREPDDRRGVTPERRGRGQHSDRGVDRASLRPMHAPPSRGQRKGHSKDVDGSPVLRTTAEWRAMSRHTPPSHSPPRSRSSTAEGGPSHSPRPRSDTLNGGLESARRQRK
jgi:hypothetical protein